MCNLFLALPLIKILLHCILKLLACHAYALHWLSLKSPKILFTTCVAWFSKYVSENTPEGGTVRRRPGEIRKFICEEANVFHLARTNWLTSFCEHNVHILRINNILLTGFSMFGRNSFGLWWRALALIAGRGSQCRCSLAIVSAL